MTQLALQATGVVLTIVGLTYTMTRPIVERLDTLNSSFIELKTQKIADTAQQAAIERRVLRIENDLYRLQERSDAARPTNQR
jgi:predicted acyltransferase